MDQKGREREGKRDTGKGSKIDRVLWRERTMEEVCRMFSQVFGGLVLQSPGGQNQLLPKNKAREWQTRNFGQTDMCYGG